MSYSGAKHTFLKSLNFQQFEPVPFHLTLYMRRQIVDWCHRLGKRNTIQDLTLSFLSSNTEGGGFVS